MGLGLQSVRLLVLRVVRSRNGERILHLCARARANWHRWWTHLVLCWCDRLCERRGIKTRKNETLSACVASISIVRNAIAIIAIIARIGFRFRRRNRCRVRVRILSAL